MVPLDYTCNSLEEKGVYLHQVTQSGLCGFWIMIFIHCVLSSAFDTFCHGLTLVRGRCAVGWFPNIVEIS